MVSVRPMGISRVWLTRPSKHRGRWARAATPRRAARLPGTPCGGPTDGRGAQGRARRRARLWAVRRRQRGAVDRRWSGQPVESAGRGVGRFALVRPSWRPQTPYGSRTRRACSRHCWRTGHERHDRLGAPLSRLRRAGPALSLGMEEHVRVLATARAVELPDPTDRATGPGRRDIVSQWCLLRRSGRAAGCASWCAGVPVPLSRDVPAPATAGPGTVRSRDGPVVSEHRHATRAAARSNPRRSSRLDQLAVLWSVAPSRRRVRSAGPGQAVELADERSC